MENLERTRLLAQLEDLKEELYWLRQEYQGGGGPGYNKIRNISARILTIRRKLQRPEYQPLSDTEPFDPPVYGGKRCMHCSTVAALDRGETTVRKYYDPSEAYTDDDHICGSACDCPSHKKGWEQDEAGDWYRNVPIPGATENK